jgi:hypothetical protein
MLLESMIKIFGFESIALLVHLCSVVHIAPPNSFIIEARIPIAALQTGSANRSFSRAKNGHLAGQKRPLDHPDGTCDAKRASSPGLIETVS